MAILIVEDHPVNQKVTVLSLRNLGYTADVVTTGRDALAALRSRPYALVLMDAQLPDMDGVETTGLIRAAQNAREPNFPSHLPVIAMTANAMSGDREYYLSAGLDDYLSKPVKPAALEEALRRHLRPAAAPACALTS